MTSTSLNTITTQDSNHLMDVDEVPKDVPQQRKKYNYSGPGNNCPYRYVDTITEDHGCCIYSVKFCHFVQNHNIFATVAGRQVTVYECKQKKIVPKACFVDDNDTEEYYAVNWTLTKVNNEYEIALIFGGKNGIIRAIHPFRGTSYCTMLGHGDAVNEIVHHPVYPSIFASASKDLTIRLWHTLHAYPLAILGGFKGHQDQILTLDFDYTGQYIVSGSMDHTLRLWNVGANEEIQKRIVELTTGSDTSQKTSIEMHFPCGQSRDLHRNYVDCIKTIKSYIFSKACENCILLSKFGEFNDPCIGGSGINGFETLSQQVAELELPNGSLWFIRFGITTGPPGNSWIACGNDIGIVHLWDLHCIPLPKKSHFQICHREFPTVIRRVEFSANGDIMIVVGDRGKVSRCDKIATKANNEQLNNESIDDDKSQNRN